MYFYEKTCNFEVKENEFFFVYFENPNQNFLFGLRPPSKRITSPLIILFSITCWTNWENSSGFPNLDGKGVLLDITALTLSGKKSVIGVSKNPGAMVTHLIPWLERSLAVHIEKKGEKAKI